LLPHIEKVRNDSLRAWTERLLPAPEPPPPPPEEAA
jgi:hypothetical protein